VKRTLFLHFLAVVFSLGIFACGTVGPPPAITPALASAGAALGVSEPELQAGRRIYTTQCTACHAARSIPGYSQAEWPGILDDMTRRARLDAVQGGQVRAFVRTSLAAQSR
jgi:cytochrome c5